MGIFDFFKGNKVDRQEHNVDEQTSFKSHNKSAEFEVLDVYFIVGLGVVLAGRVVSGVLLPGFKANINGKTAVVKHIESHHEQMSSANVGDNVGIHVVGVDKNDLKKGMILVFQE